MKTLWTYIEEKNWKRETKYRAFTWIFAALAACIGFCVWMILRRWVLSTWDWMVCFLIYPVILSWFAVFLYSCRHTFRDKQN